MAVVSFTNYRPPARYDSVAWTAARIKEAATEDGTYTTIDTVSLGVPDADPAHPAARNFTTTLGTAADQWYEVVFLDAFSNTSEPTTPVQNLTSAIVAADPYATVDELARILKIREPTAAQTVALERVLRTAAGEINSEIELVNGDLSGWQLDLATQVNLDRGADLWRHTESVPGLLGVLDDQTTMAATPGRYSWARYAARLSPIKARWGIA